MNIEELVTLLRTEIEKTNIKCYSPDLPQNDEMCCAIQLGEGTNQSSIPQHILYSEIPFYILIRGTTNDTETRRLADTIFNQLHFNNDLSLNDTHITFMRCNTPNYAFRDENQRIYYNINCNLRVEWSD